MRVLALALALVAACGDNLPGPDLTFDGTGGTLEIAGCGYAVTTRYNASAPQVASGYVGPDPTPTFVHLGLRGDPRTSMVVQWRTEDEVTSATELRYAVGEDLPASALTQRATGIVFGYQPLGDLIYRQHQVHLCGLQPGTTYSYQIAGGSAVYSFRTAPDVGVLPDAETVIAFVGDSRGGYDVWEDLVGQIVPRAPDLMLFSGDAVTYGANQDEWDEFFGRAEPMLARVPLVAVHGNHEANNVAFYSQIAMPADQENFGLDLGHAHLTVANDTPDDPAELATSTRDAIRADFEASSGARWKLLSHHQPMYSAAMNHGSSTTLQAAWLDLVDTHQIDLVLNGHEHDFEITKPLRASVPQATNADGTVYVVAGGAGAPLYDNGTLDFTEYSEKTYSAAIVRVRRDQLTLDAFRPDGTTLPAGLTKIK